MFQPTRSQSHLIVAAIRVLSHQLQRAPRPEEVAEMLQMPPASLRMNLAALHDLGIVVVVESAYDSHVEVRDYRRLEELAPDQEAGNLSEDLADFERRKREEAEKMARLFSENDHQKRKAERHRQMESQLRDFPKQKPPDPFAED